MVIGSKLPNLCFEFLNLSTLENTSCVARGISFLITVLLFGAVNQGLRMLAKADLTMLGHPSTHSKTFMSSAFFSPSPK